MELPSYFLADLPPEAILTASLLKEAGQTLKRNRNHFLAGRPIWNIIEVIRRVAENWKSADDPFRMLALSEGPSRTGFSKETLATGIDEFFGQLTTKNLRNLVLQDLGHMERAEQLQSNELEQSADRASFVRGPEFILHFASGNLPNPTWTSMMLGFLAKSAQFVKCASGASFLPRIFAHSIYAVDRKLGACLEIAEWKGGSRELEDALYEEADCITATGSDEALEQIRKALPGHLRFIGYGNRVSFGFVARESLSPGRIQHFTADAARDVVAWDQLGCLSPHLIYAEGGGAVTPMEFAEALANELAAIEKREPRGPVSANESAAITSRRAFYQVRAAHFPSTKMWSSSGSTAWTVVFEQDPQFQLSCLNRFVYVKEIASLEEALRGAEMIRGKVSTVGLAAPADRASTLANQLANWGVARICPIGRMQKPPLTWRHDGRPALAEFFSWSDWELDSL